MFTLWFTGLSGSGKSTLSQNIYEQLRQRDVKVELFDGDIIRSILCTELGFSRKDREINVRRIGYIAHLLNKHGVATIVAAIAPYEEPRRQNRSLIGNYVEVFCDCALDALVARDPKGLYKRALAGEIHNFTGVSDPYERPEDPDIHVHTDVETIEQSAAIIMRHLDREGLVSMATPATLDDAACKEERMYYKSLLAELGFLHPRPA